MAHFAELDANNTVVRVIVVHNNDLLDNGVESEQKGIEFCKSLFGNDTVWVQTSYNRAFRKNYAGFGFTYDAQRDAFIPPQTFNGWILNETTCIWEAPIPYPNDGNAYRWNENTSSWELITNE